MSPSPSSPSRILEVHSFDQLASTPLARGINALCWRRTLPGDFAEVVRMLGPGAGVVAVDEDDLGRLPATAAGLAAIRVLREDLRLLRELGLAPELDCIHDYARDERDTAVPTHVLSFHVDRAPVETDTWLCTYHGAASEGLRNEDARRLVDDPRIRARLLAEFGGADGAAFGEWLVEENKDLHYAAAPGARPFAFGVGNLWRIATQWPGSPVPPCIHRAPAPRPGDGPRLLLIA